MTDTDMAELGAQLRIDSIRSTTEAGSGHPTSSMSAADLMAVLLAKHLRYDWNAPQSLNNDRLIFSKGHASPLLYAMYKAAGVISDREMLTLRKLDSPFEGHPKPRSARSSWPGLPWVDVATGSLGQGLATAVGMGLVGKNLAKRPFKIWVLLGDSEMAEGSVWEAFDKAAHDKLDNIVAILDMNRLGQRGPTEFGWDADVYANRAKAFGWATIEIDGHDVKAIGAAFAKCAKQKKPTLVVAKTVKGSGVSFLANKEGWHGKALDAKQMEAAIAELGGLRGITVAVAKPEEFIDDSAVNTPIELPKYKLGTEEATRRAFGDALVAIGKARPNVVVLDGEVANSTYTDAFQQAFPERFFEVFIAEQQLVSAAVGMSVLGKTAFAATFAAFLTRAYDQIRMAAVSGANLRLCGSHVGVSIGEDGPSQMGLEDLSMMRAIHGSTVLYPCDPNQAARLTAAMVDLSGISYLRTTRGKLPAIYGPDEAFPVGGSKVLRQSKKDQATLIAAGVTLHESLKAYEQLKKEGILVRVIDLYSVKPVDAATLQTAAQETENRFFVIEDHWAEGGLGDAVLDAFTGGDQSIPKVTKLAVRILPGSGKPEELLSVAGIDGLAIAQAVREAIGAKTPPVEVRPRLI